MSGKSIVQLVADHLREATRKLKLVTTMNRALSDSLAPTGDTSPSNGEHPTDLAAR